MSESTSANETDQKRTEQKVTRAEWGVVLSLLLSAGSVIFSAGVVWTTVQEHDRRLIAVEAVQDDQGKTIARIDANVTFLTERAREDREFRRQR
jgi:hypothetical protein